MTALASDEGNHRKEDKEKGKEENEAAIPGQLLGQTAPEAHLPMNFFQVIGPTKCSLVASPFELVFSATWTNPTKNSQCRDKEVLYFAYSSVAAGHLKLSIV